MLTGEHPAVAEALRYGLQPAYEPECPLCGARPELFYFGPDRACLGCEECVRAVGSWEI